MLKEEASFLFLFISFFIVDSLWNKIHGHFKDIHYAVFANIEFNMPKKGVTNINEY